MDNFHVIYWKIAHYHFKLNESMKWEEFNTTYKLVCVVISIILTLYWSCKYAKDEDTSLVRYTQYAASETKDEYPVLSFCLKNPFLKEKLKEFGVNGEEEYLEFLEGKTFNSSFMKIPYDNITLKLSDYLIDDCETKQIEDSFTSLDQRK